MTENIPKYTIDLDSLVKLFREEGTYTKKHFKTLWNNIEGLIKDGVIISHAEVLEEIKDGGKDELRDWAMKNKGIFKNYDLAKEPPVISTIGEKFPSFLTQNKEKPNNADPWLVAQAMLSGLTLITEEKRMRDMCIPKVCLHFNVRYIDIFGLIRENNWTM